MRSSLWAAIAGLIAITIYLVLERALVSNTPVASCLLGLLQWDASNAYGATAFRGGWPMASIGLAMDFGVSLVWAVVFSVVFANVTFVRRHLIVSGLVFGAVVMAIMIFFVVPLGHAPQMHKTPGNLLNVLIAHTVFFGVPVALAVRRELG